MLWVTLVLILLLIVGQRLDEKRILEAYQWSPKTLDTFRLLVLAREYYVNNVPSNAFEEWDYTMASSFWQILESHDYLPYPKVVEKIIPEYNSILYGESSNFVERIEEGEWLEPYEIAKRIEAFDRLILLYSRKTDRDLIPYKYLKKYGTF